MTALRELLADFGVKFDDRQMTRGHRGIEQTKRSMEQTERRASRLGDALKGVGVAMAAAFAGNAARQMVNTTVEATNELGRWSERLQMSIVDLHGFTQIGRRFGADVDDVTDAFKELQLKARDALEGTQSYVDAFQLVGISTEQLRPIVDDQVGLFNLFADAIQRTSSAATQNFAIDELMSDAGTRMAGVFRLGSSEINRMRREARRLGGAEMPALARQTREYTLRLRAFDQGWERIRNTLVSAVLPGLTRLAEGATRAIDWLRDMHGSTELARAALITLGTVAGTVGLATAATWAPVALTVAGAAAGIGLLVLALDDLFVTAEGGKSVTRDLLETLLGYQRANEVINNLNTGIQDLRETLAGVAGFFGITIGDADTDVGRANRRGQGALRSFQETVASPFVAADEAYRSATQGRAQSLSGADQRILPLMQSRLAARRYRRREGGAYLESQFPEVFDESAWDPGVRDIFASQETLNRSRMSIPQGPAEITIDARSTIDISEASDAAEVRRIIRDENDRQLRAIGDAVSQGAQ